MRREEEDAGYRHLRLQGLILEELRALLRDDVSDPLLADVRVTAVVLSVDYRHARVHFATVVSDQEERSGRAALERALGRATPFLRARLADAIDLKRVPDLRFVFDGVLGSGADDAGRAGRTEPPRSG
jgi:ribosome-binding factor A